MIFKLFRNELVGILPLVTYIISPFSFQLLPPPTPQKSVSLNFILLCANK